MNGANAGAELYLKGEIQLRQSAQSITSNHERIFICYEHDFMMDVVFLNNLRDKIQTDILKGYISHPKDLMILGDFLFACGEYYKKGKIYKIHVHLQQRPVNIYDSNVPGGDIMKLSISVSRNIMLIQRRQILHLSVDYDRLQEINFGFNIYDALQLDDSHYVICNIRNEVHIIDSLGNISYSPPNEWSIDSSPRSLARDGHDHILVNDHFSRDIFIFDPELNFKGKTNVHERTICIDYSNGLLLALTQSANLKLSTGILTQSANLKLFNWNFVAEPNNLMSHVAKSLWDISKFSCLLFLIAFHTYNDFG